MNNAIRFPFALAAGYATVTATLVSERYEIQAATGTDGQAVPVTPGDLDRIEAYLDACPFVVTRAYSVAQTHALDVMTGETAPFIVCHDQGQILDISYGSTGSRAKVSGEQFTEVAEAFAIDRQADMEEEGFHDRFAKF